MVRKTGLLAALIFLILAPLFLVLPSVVLIPNETHNDADFQQDYYAASISENSTPMRKITLVSADPTSYTDEFAYIAAISESVFNQGGTQYISPLILSDGSESENWLIDDWVEYLDADGGLTQAISIGDFSQNEIMQFQDRLGVQIYPQLSSGTSAEIAALLALNDWRSSDMAVFAMSADNFDEPTVTSGEATYTFQNAEVQRDTGSITVSSINPVNISFTPPAGAGWIDGNFSWSGIDVFTHELFSPSGEVVDYSVISQTYQERRYPYLPSLVPLYTWIPVLDTDEWRMVLQPEIITPPVSVSYAIKYHPGFTRTISVPTDANWLNVSVGWDNAGEILNVALIDPEGRLGQWAPAVSVLSSAGGKRIELPYPKEGEWTLVCAWMDATSEQNNVDISWDISRLQSDLQAYLESAANGAVLASLLNLPLLYVTPDGIPTATQIAIDRLGINWSILVDPLHLHLDSLVTALSAFSSVTNYDSYLSVTDAIKAFSGENDIVVTIPLGTGSELFAPAAFSAAVHGAPIFSLAGDDNSVTTLAEETWAPYLIGPEIDIFVQSRYSTRTENGWYDERIPNKFSMMESADVFEQFVDDRGAYNSTTAQSVVVVSPIDIIKPSFDRSIHSHFITGRIPAENPQMASVMINKAALNRFLFHTAQSADDVLMTLYAYTDGALFGDNFGSSYEINQIEDISSALQAEGFSILQHVGVDAVFEAVASQLSMWSLSTHGTLTRYPTDPPDRPTGLGMFSLRDQDAVYGFEVSVSERESTTDTDRLVNPVVFEAENIHHVLRTTSDLENAIGNIGSPIITITACLLGGSEMPLMLMEHGAVAVTAAPRTVYFQPAGLLSILMTQALTSGNTTGEALNYALRRVSADYTNPLTTDPIDYANQQILFGDPEVMLYTTTEMPRTTSINPVTNSFDGRTPGRGVPAVSGLGSSDYLPVGLSELGIDFDYYESSNFTEFLSLLTLRMTAIVEPGTLPVLSTFLASNLANLNDFVYNGGVLAMLGVSGDLGWMPWNMTFDSTNTGATISIIDPDHPLMSSPNTISTLTDYHGSFTTNSANLSILATDGQNPVIVAGSLGFGKLALSTTHPSDSVRNITIENLVTWGQSPSVMLRSVVKNQEIIWEGDQVIITIELTDQIGNGIEDADIQVWFNSTSAAATDVGSGLYVVTLDGAWTSGRAGIYYLLLTATKSGYDSLSILLMEFMFIRPSPLLFLAILGGGIVAVVVLFQYRKYRRGEKILPSRERKPKRTKYQESSEARELRKKEEKERKKRRKDEEEKFDASEFFGV
ncbi:MAG: C25 family cysteine peptidase [Candidatus Thorarchaeota archaeon]